MGGCEGWGGWGGWPVGRDDRGVPFAEDGTAEDCRRRGDVSVFREGCRGLEGGRTRGEAAMMWESCCESCAVPYVRCEGMRGDAFGERPAELGKAGKWP